jgi:hypothetical protein
MQQRVLPAGIDVGVVLHIPRAVEETVRVAAFGKSVPDEVADRIQFRRDHVRIALLIPSRVEQTGHRPDKSGFRIIRPR